MKTLNNTDINGATKQVSDLELFGDGDLWQLISKASSKEEVREYKWKEKPRVKAREIKTGEIATYSEDDGLKVDYHGKYGKIIGGRPAGSAYCVKCRRISMNADGWWIKIRSRKDYDTNRKRIFICNNCWSPKSTY